MLDKMNGAWIGSKNNGQIAEDRHFRADLGEGAGGAQSRGSPSCACATRIDVNI
jgi:hypothetical protein